MNGPLTHERIAEALGKTGEAVKKRAQREGWPFREVSIPGPPGRVKDYGPFVDQLPDEVRGALMVKRGLAGVPAVKEKPTGKALGPEALEKAALKAELVGHFNRAGGRGEKAEFVEAYNTGTLFPRIYAAVGRTSVSALYRWSKQLRESGDLVVLTDERGGRRGASGITPEEAEVLGGLLLNQNRVRVETAIRYAKRILESRGVPSPSGKAAMRRWATELQERYRDVWVLARDGEKALTDKVLPYIERNPELLGVGDVLVADGHTCNFTVVSPFTGKAVRPTLIAWLDWASRDVAGFVFGLREDSFAIHAALRNAIFRLGKIPRAVLLDNGKAFKARVFLGGRNLEEAGLRGLYGRLGIQVGLARPYNARAKVVERFFRTLSDQFERLLPSFVGASIEDKPARMMRNEKFMRELSPARPLNLDEAYERLEAWLDGFYRSEPHGGLGGRTPGEVFEAGRGSGIDSGELDFLMMSEAGRTVRQNGVRFLGDDYWDEALYGLGGRVNVRYDLGARESILVYDQAWEFICEARRVEKAHPYYRLLEGEEKEKARELVSELSKRQAGLKKETKKLVRFASGLGAGLRREEHVYAALAEEARPVEVQRAEEPIQVRRIGPGDWEKTPEGVKGDPLNWFVWLGRKARAVGLAGEDHEQLCRLVRNYDWLADYFFERAGDYPWEVNYLREMKERRAAL